MGSQGLDHDGARAPMGCSNGACSMALGSSAWVLRAPSQVPPQQSQAPASKHGLTPALITGLSALALLGKQDCAGCIQPLGRGPLGISAASQALPCPESGLAIRKHPEPSGHSQPITCPQPHCPPAWPGTSRQDSGDKPF